MIRARLALPAALLLLAPATACRKIPLTPKKALPAGTLVLRFGRTLKGPLDLTLDDVRVPVEVKKKGNALVITGLSVGLHRYFLSSPQDAFGPASGQVSLSDDRGGYEVVLAQHLNAELYGKPADAAPATGLPGVTARLEKW